jgi:hypothetical protein
MLRKLVEISLGRQGRTTDTGLPAAARGNNAHAMFSSVSGVTLPVVESSPEKKRLKSNNMASLKSMHIASRKRELQRIELENVKIDQKIFDIKPHISAYTDRIDYAKSSKVKVNL